MMSRPFPAARGYSAHPMANIGRVRGLAHLAIADHVNPGRDLFCHDVVNRLRCLGFKGCRIDGTARLTRENEGCQRLRAR